MKGIVIKGTAIINSINSVENNVITLRFDCHPSASSTHIGNETKMPTDEIIRVSKSPPHWSVETGIRIPKPPAINT